MSSNTLKLEVQGVRQILGWPLDNSPGVYEIVKDIEAEYQAMTNKLNFTENAWSVAEYTLSTVAGTYRYRLDNAINYFQKALMISTVPANTAGDPEYVLEYYELENIPKEWAWLGVGKGQYMFSSHDSQLFAIYRTMAAEGERIYMEMRPIPNSAQDYKILYQQGNWIPAMESTGLTFVLPHESQRYLMRNKVAQKLLYRGVVKWSHDDRINAVKSASILRGIEMSIKELADDFKDYKASLETVDIVYTDAWADETVNLSG